jgi:hypothetical protein
MWRASRASAPARAGSSPDSRLMTAVSAAASGKSKAIDRNRCRVEGFSFFSTLW